MLLISGKVGIPEAEIQLRAIRAQGAGGQRVNKVATAIHLRFDIRASSLPEYYKQRLLNLADQRISAEGIITIKAQRYRTQENNRLDALNRLQALLRSVAVPRKRRLATAVPASAKQKRLAEKTRRGAVKALRRPVKQD